jgi:hypothetical protein
MSLLVTIFLLVFITELISWIGKSVLLELVRSFHVHRIPVFLCVSFDLTMTSGFRDHSSMRGTYVSQTHLPPQIDVHSKHNY